MLKLIDVEKLEEDKADCCVPLTQWQEGWNDAIDVIIGEAPTVEAIPIEYIQKWNDNYIADTMRNGRTIINQMLEDWEKENEPLRD